MKNKKALIISVLVVFIVLIFLAIRVGTAKGREPGDMNVFFDNPTAETLTVYINGKEDSLLIKPFTFVYEFAIPALNEKNKNPSYRVTVYKSAHTLLMDTTFGAPAVEYNHYLINPFGKKYVLWKVHYENESENDTAANESVCLIDSSLYFGDIKSFDNKIISCDNYLWRMLTERSIPNTLESGQSNRTYLMRYDDFREAYNRLQPLSEGSSRLLDFRNKLAEFHNNLVNSITGTSLEDKTNLSKLDALYYELNAVSVQSKDGFELIMKKITDDGLFYETQDKAAYDAIVSEWKLVKDIDDFKSEAVENGLFTEMHEQVYHGRRSGIFERKLVNLTGDLILYDQQTGGYTSTVFSKN